MPWHVQTTTVNLLLIPRFRVRLPARAPRDVSRHSGGQSPATFRFCRLCCEAVDLDALDDVDWSSLTHAYGPATTTADELRTLLSGDDRQRSEALASLVASICHQGSVYPATAPAVPFLTEIAASPSLPSAFRVEVVQLLEFIAEGAVNLGRYHPDWAAEEWALALSRNLRAAGSRLLTVLRGPDAGVLRAWVVWFIHALPPTSQDLDMLRKAINREQDEVVKASIGLTLPPEDPVQRDLISIEEHPLVRLAAAAQLIATDRDLDHCVTVAKECVPQTTRFAEMPIRADDTSPVRLIASRLGTVSPDRQHFWIALWVQDRHHCVEALYAAWEASETRRSSARALLDPVTQVLRRPPLETQEFLGTAALSLTMLGLPGMNRLRELTSSLTGDALERVKFYLANAERETSLFAQEQPMITPQRRPKDLAALLHDVRPHHISELDAVKALDELAAWGPAASEQAPEVGRLLDETKSVTVRVHAARALARIAGDAERSVQVLIREFDEHHWQGAMIARVLGELGPSAATAIPILRDYVDRDFRPRDITALRDDLAAAACVEAIARIQPPSSPS